MSEVKAPVIRQGFQTEDGVMHATKAAAMEYLRRPLKAAALNALNSNSVEVTNWMLDNEEKIYDVFKSTTIRRVTKSEKNKLEAALKAVEASGEKAFAFLIENKEAVADSFRWPSVKRGTEEEQAATIRDGFMALTGDNTELVAWLVANQEAILEAFNAGVIKREVSEKAANGLKAYREKQAAEKAAKLAAEAQAAEAK